MVRSITSTSHGKLRSKGILSSLEVISLQNQADVNQAKTIGLILRMNTHGSLSWKTVHTQVLYSQPEVLSGGQRLFRVRIQTFRISASFVDQCYPKRTASDSPRAWPPSDGALPRKGFGNRANSLQALPHCFACSAEMCLKSSADQSSEAEMRTGRLIYKENAP